MAETHRLDVTVVSASSLPWVERDRGCDAMVKVKFEGQSKETKVVVGVNPVWNETLHFDLKKKPSNNSQIIIKVYDEQIIKNRFLGSTELSFGSILSSDSVTCKIKDKNKEELKSTIKLYFRYISPSDEETLPTSMSREAPLYTSDTVEESERNEERHTPVTAIKDSAKDSNISDDEGYVSPCPAPRNTAFNREQSSFRSKLPQRLTDFQVRVHVINGRQLQGGHMNPVVKVICGTTTKRSIQAKGTNNPFFDQLFFFNFRDYPSKVFDETLELRVLNSRINLVYSEIIGTFKLDLGQIYDQPDHCYIKKWLLLSDPENPFLGPKGYLLFSAYVLSPGVVPKPYPPLSDDSIDVESNVLSATGVNLNLMTLQIRVYLANDLPQMDPDYYEYIKEKFKRFFGIDHKKKDLVDPYCTIKFAGHKAKTNKIKNNDDPIWYKQFNVAFRFPSMCDRIRIRLMDHDDTSMDDTIGTAFIRLSDISSPGQDNSGFLPTFGPCFVNIYGSPREFCVLPDKYDHLNKGVFRGVSYRGRVMVEIATLPDRTPTTSIEDILQVHIKSIKPFQRTRRYKLFAVFYSATMISPSDSTVEFEVSIGNYGNILDENTDVQMSTTPPKKPVHDGNYYYYMPWYDYKPAILVESKWEDNTHRIKSMNFFIHIYDKLADRVFDVREQLSKEETPPTVDCIGILMEALNEVYTALTDTKNPFPAISKTDETVNDLDKLKYNARKDELESIKKLILNNSKLQRHELTLEDVLDLAESVLLRLETLTIEPQVSVPDIIIWMLSGEKRVACCRLPAHEFMYFDESSIYNGKNCDRILNIHLKPPAVENEEELENAEPAGALIRIKLWLGLESKWKQNMSADVAMFAETYENEVSHLGIWNKNPWSDSTGKVKEDRDRFKLPPGWEWEDEWDRFIGDWEVMTSIDTGEYQTRRRSRKYVENIYEYQSRNKKPPFNWPFDESDSEWKNEEGHSLSYYTEDSRQVRDTLQQPDGWEWDSEWSIAPHRATDEDGWEYKGLDLLLSDWAPHLRRSIIRRRLWNRTRIQTGDATIKTSTGDKYEGWEYAHISSSTYHQEHSPLFVKRRRRYLRKIKTKTQAKLSNPPRFIFPEHQQVQVPPRLYFPMKGLFKYELRVYLYQARDLYAGNSTGLSDPYCIVSFEHYSQTTREINQTLTPLWDHTCVFDDIKMFGSPSDVKGSPPKIMIEIFDKDNVGKDYLGYVECYPIVHINENQQQRRQVSLEEPEGVLHVPFSLEGAEPVDEPKDPVTSLSWYQVTRYGRYAGQLLAAFELFLVDSVCPPPILEREYDKTDKKKWWYTVPHGIRPEYETKTIKILCWGVRNLKKYKLGCVTSPCIKVECGGVVRTTNHIIDTRRNPNFIDGPIIMELELPVNPLYCPPLNIYLYDKRAFGQKPLIGTYSVQITEDSPAETDRPSPQPNPLEIANTLRQRKSKSGQVAIDMEAFYDEDPDYIKDSRFDWWTKYRLAVFKATGSELQDSEIEYVNENHDHLKLFHHELEKEPRFHNFSDVVKSYPLYRGKGSIAFDDPSENTRFAGTFKGHITVKRGKHTEIDPDHQYFPTKDLCPVVIRVYVVEGIGLLPLDPNCKSDPYLRLSIGKCVMDDADNFVPNSLNPVFGKMFELSATLPLDHTLKIQVLDHDYCSRDDFIGQTEIDIENRFISRYRASCGIPETFSRNGPNHWRDTDLPTDILNWYCKVNGLNEPVITAYSIVYNCDEYTIDHTDLNQYMRQHKYVGSPIQQIALALLRREEVLVHEHVETRTLENPNQPGISQGLLRIWVDIFPKSYNLPPPVDISPRKPEDYELRVIVYDVKDVKLADYNLVTDEDMSDIYVKGWLSGQEETQKTDVHYRSFDGEGNFNYRFVFPFQYLPAEKRIVVSKRKFFDVNKTEIRARPHLTIQVWDNDKFKFDDHLATIEFDLTAIQQGTRTSSFLDQIMRIGSNISYSDQKSIDSSNSSSEQISTTSASKTSLLNQVMNTSDSTDNLFEKKRIRRWWPLADEGMIELELQILTKEEAELSPAGKGRDEPNMNPYLPPPQRPETSFFWLTSPLKTFKHIIWKYYKCRIIIGFFVIFAVVGVIVFLYSAPDYLAQYLLDRLLPL